MSEPLELVTYLRDEDGDYQHPITGLWWSGLEVEDEKGFKRFTDAELAAEYHQQSERHTMLCYDDVYLRYVEENPTSTTGPERYQEFRRAQTLYRFAVLPHYDEAQA